MMEEDVVRDLEDPIATPGNSSLLCDAYIPCIK